MYVVEVAMETGIKKKCLLNRFRPKNMSASDLECQLNFGQRDKPGYKLGVPSSFCHACISRPMSNCPY